MRPPRLVHENFRRCDNMPAIAADAAAALHMGKGERALLLFYSRHSTGFQPALQAIANATGMNRSQVYRNRNALYAHGIADERDGCLYIDWARLRIYASLDPKLTSKRCVTAPYGSVGREAPLLTPNDFLLLDMTELTKRLAALTEAEYASLRQRMKEEYTCLEAGNGAGNPKNPGKKTAKTGRKTKTTGKTSTGSWTPMTA